MSRVLISYSHSDTKFVANLREVLIRFGYTPWVDWTHILNTTDWLDNAHAGIEECTQFIFVVSNHSLASDCCAKELRHALDHNKHIIPLLRSRQIEAAVSSRLNARDLIDFSENSVFDISVQMLLRAITSQISANR